MANRWQCLLTVSALGVLCAGSVQAQWKLAFAPQPADWKPGGEVRAYAGGDGSVVREFVWGQKLQPGSGVIRIKAVDRVWQEQPGQQDELGEVVARFKVPAEKAEYYIKFKRLAEQGWRQPPAGGVLTNHDMFGNTEIGGPGIFPRLRAHVAVWGYANVVKNGKVIGRDRYALAWVGQGARGEDGKWLYQPDKDKVAAHLVLFGTLGHGEGLADTPDGFLHFEWPAAKVVMPGGTLDTISPANQTASN